MTGVENIENIEKAKKVKKVEEVKKVKKYISLYNVPLLSPSNFSSPEA